MGPGEGKVRGGQSGVESRCGQRGGDEGRGDHSLSSPQSAVHCIGGWHTDRAARMEYGLPSRAQPNSPTSATCTSASASANCGCKAPRKARRSLSPSTLTWNAIWSSACARPLCRLFRPRLCWRWPRPTWSTTTRSSRSAAPASTPATWPRSTWPGSSFSACNTSLKSRPQSSICASRRFSFCCCSTTARRSISSM